MTILRLALHGAVALVLVAPPAFARTRTLLPAGQRSRSDHQNGKRLPGRISGVGTVLHRAPCGSLPRAFARSAGACVSARVICQRWRLLRHVSMSDQTDAGFPSRQAVPSSIPAALKALAMVGLVVPSVSTISL